MYLIADLYRRLGKRGRSLAWLQALSTVALKLESKAERDELRGMVASVSRKREYKGLYADEKEVAYIAKALSIKGIPTVTKIEPVPTDVKRLDIPKTSMAFFVQARSYIMKFRKANGRYPSSDDELLEFANDKASFSLNGFRDPVTDEDMFYRKPNASRGAFKNDPIPILIAKDPLNSVCPLRLYADGRIFNRDTKETIPYKPAPAATKLPGKGK